MSDSGKKVICILSSIILCTEARAITDDSANPYQGIVDRNVFGLKPPTILPPVETKKTDLAPITLTGVTTILSSKRALFNLQPPGKPVQSFILAEGQREGDIEVLEIDEKAGSVKLNQSGTTVSLTFEKNGAKLPTAVAAAGNPGAPGVLPQVSFTPAKLDSAGNGNGFASPMKSIPTRNSLPQGGNQPGAGPMNNMSASFGGVPTSGFNSPGSSQPAAIDPDAHAMQMLAEHVQHRDKGIEMPPLPPPLAEALGEGNPSTPNNPQPRSPANFPPSLPRSPGLPNTPPPLPQ